ncbi:probable aminopeptidase NPEPL1 isoform X2 [Bemisia tabaci]|uniref:probable aminopeptidase NPEPL1 isoform X2 n=1 Tax=Bemisia tabaci TaxID=7038 RepID=UPI0008F9E111|nr:PREDICTED: probable aminopeptidase NPEPL1 isoform X2 [Bemisia tabaci]
MTSSTSLSFSASLSKSDPLNSPVLIIGQVKNLQKVKFRDISCKLEPRVTEEVYLSALVALHPSPTDSIPLYLNLATIAALPSKSSRHNSASSPHSITKIVKSATFGVNEYIVIVCEKSDVFASACAVARAFPLYSRKTSKPSSVDSATQTVPATVTVEFIIVGESENEGDLSLTSSDLQTLEAAAKGIRLTAKIVDIPCNEMNVDDFLMEIKAIKNELGSVSLTIIRGEELKEQGFGGIYGVGKAASVPPALAVLSHTPPRATETVAWVGKGIVYDTGGLSIKGKTTMPGMKRDCAGAAAVLGAFYTVVKLGYRQNLHAVFCLAENSVGPKATRPDDIHTLYSGRTVEINNTDAEGRLVLADGVVFAYRNLEASIILDIATLTGAQGVATGKYHGAILSNSAEWENLAFKAGLTSGDLLFPIPYCPELHFPEYASAVADMKNSVADRSNAQPSCAGLFIQSHLGFDTPCAWIHVDMAGPAYCGERGTGYGVALLATLFGHNTSDKILQSLSETPKSCSNNEDRSCKRPKRF